MRRERIPPALRRQVIARAQMVCEYCLLHQDDSLTRHNVDHIIARKHRGLTELGNLALACADCNLSKGSDIATLDPNTGQLVRLFDPRRDTWTDHFVLVMARIEGKTALGRATVALLQLNEPTRIQYRALLQSLGRYPRNEPS